MPLAAVPLVVDSVSEVYAALTGVAGPEPAASAIASAWAERRGVRWTVQSRQHLLMHKAIVPSGNPPRGALRLVTADERDLAWQWGAAFAAESGLGALDGRLCVELVARKQLYVWEDGGPRCMLGVLRETRDAAAIGVLYTPPAHRERGYAAAIVDAFSRRLLERGMSRSYFCLEPSNSAAYAICQRLGYGVVQETVDIDFV